MTEGASFRPKTTCWKRGLGKHGLERIDREVFQLQEVPNGVPKEVPRSLKEMADARPPTESYYYQPDLAPEEFIGRVRDSEGGIDDLDHSVYALLNYYSGEFIRRRLALAEITHPYEIARKLKAQMLGQDEPSAEPIEEIEEEDWDRMSKLEKARRKLGG